MKLIRFEGSTTLHTRSDCAAVVATFGTDTPFQIHMTDPATVATCAECFAADFAEGPQDFFGGQTVAVYTA